MQPPTMVLNLPNPTYYYALPSGVVLNPTPAVAVPYPVYYEDPYSQETAASPPPPASNAAAPAKGNFAVLAGSFLEENLAQLSERYIQSLGYPSYRQKITVKDKQFTRIYAGPFPKKKEASDASKEMQAKYNMPGVVVPFRP
ncbi:MAG: hypothetical protein G8345_15345, partial [Magnetococcales bacterium]|nr:hypothetical protein [Magnetococcales bacterium]